MISSRVDESLGESGRNLFVDEARIGIIGRFIEATLKYILTRLPVI